MGKSMKERLLHQTNLAALIARTVILTGRLFAPIKASCPMSALEIAMGSERVPRSDVVKHWLRDVHRIVIVSYPNVELANAFAVPIPMGIVKVLMPLAAVLLSLEAVDATVSVVCVAFSVMMKLQLA